MGPDALKSQIILPTHLCGLRGLFAADYHLLILFNRGKFLCELAATVAVSLEASAGMSLACVQQKHLWSSGFDSSLAR